MSEGGISLVLEGEAASVVRACKEAALAENGLTRQSANTKKVLEQVNKEHEKNVALINTVTERNKRLALMVQQSKEAFGQQSAKMKQLSDDYMRMVRDTGKSIEEQQRLRRELVQTREEMTRTGKSGETAFSGMGTSVTTLIMGLVSVGGVLGTIKASLQDLEQRAGAAKAAAMTVEEAEVSIARNMLATDNPEADAKATADVVARGREIAARRQVPVENVQSAIAAGLSASGGDIEATLGAVDMQAELNRSTPANMAAGVEGQVNVARIMGTSNAAAAQGVMELVGQNSAIRDSAKLAQNATPVLAAADAFGMDINEVGAFFSTLTKQTGDPLGESSRTATISFVEQLATFFDQGAGQSLNQGAVGSRGYGLGFGEMVAAVQDDPRLREEFQKGLSLEARSVGPVKQLLEDSGGTFSTNMFKSIASMPTDEEGLANLVESARKRVSAPPSVAVGDAQRGMDSVQQGILLGEQARAGAGVFSKEELGQLLSAAQLSSVDVTGAETQFDLRRTQGGESRQDAFINTIQDVINNVREGERLSGNEVPIDETLSAALTRLVTIGEEQVRLLKEQQSLSPARGFDELFQRLSQMQLIDRGLAQKGREPIRNP